MGAGPAEAGPSLRAAPELSELELDLTEAPEPPTDWVSERGPFAIVHAEEDDRQVARRLSRHATEAVPRLAAALGVPAGRTMHVYVAPDEETFNSMQPGRVPDWADGTAWPLRGLIYLHTPSERIGTDEPLEQVLDHEIVHVLLGQAFAPRRVPTWLQEGLAQHAARQHTSRHTEAIASGMLGDNLLSLESLSRRFPADPIRARLAYAQSADLVAYIDNEYGDRFKPVVVTVDYTENGEQIEWDYEIGIGDAVKADANTLHIYGDGRLGEDFVTVAGERYTYTIREEPRRERRGVPRGPGLV